MNGTSSSEGVHLDASSPGLSRAAAALPSADAGDLFAIGRAASEAARAGYPSLVVPAGYRRENRWPVVMSTAGELPPYIRAGELWETLKLSSAGAVAWEQDAIGFGVQTLE